jgi:NAD(P)-dependent dehydrogenase (short-subunit alcohol dehydrogenase family)
MLLEDKNTVIYGDGGSVACAFAREGARVVLAGRARDKLEADTRDRTRICRKSKLARVLKKSL